ENAGAATTLPQRHGPALRTNQHPSHAETPWEQALPASMHRPTGQFASKGTPMKATLQALAAAAALAAASLAVAQTGNGSTTMAPGSPTTPPTHPTERTTPSDRLPTTTDDRLPAARDQGAGQNGQGTAAGSGSTAEAMQACKNLSSRTQRQDCMDKVARGAGSKSSSSTDNSGRGASGNPSGTSAGTYEKGSTSDGRGGTPSAGSTSR
ncbi:MAG TPA: hypothetical protein VLU41_06685, partial [Ideonella sp.]|nr:hypothetical protein [Ideonella sp.]